ncbi:ATP-binding protein [Saccharothrix sp. S26]|uniref:ATP-binding protein n=1 Tax=Saccharothrix sp. S26 TaxID=2907215 RepID=UPI001F490485|nr:ATP-binding protein [Saccharothrix sp. S26]MCE6995533.1 ATP-binding protein [Saccharothrix sp. S26]
MDRAEAEPDPDRLLLDLTGRPTPPLVQVRRWAVTAMADLDDDHLQAVLLVATELVANAYDHAHPHRVRLRRSRVPCQVRIEVEDTSPARPILGRSRLGEHRGRGLVMVDNLTRHQWGTQARSDGGTGKTVWAVTSCDGDEWTPCGPRDRAGPP